MVVQQGRFVNGKTASPLGEKLAAKRSDEGRAYGCVAVVVNQTFNATGLLFEYTQSRHQPDYFCFQDIATRKK